MWTRIFLKTAICLIDLYYKGHKRSGTCLGRALSALGSSWLPVILTGSFLHHLGSWAWCEERQKKLKNMPKKGACKKRKKERLKKDSFIFMKEWWFIAEWKNEESWSQVELLCQWGHTCMTSPRSCREWWLVQQWKPHREQIQLSVRPSVPENIWTRLSYCSTFLMFTSYVS